MELTKGTIVADRFRLESPLGQGGMGAVWLAQHLSLDIPCALKFLHAGAAGSPALRGRFEREARAAAQLRSPNVVQILDHGVWEGVPYIAMELLEGEDLEQRLARVGCLDPRELVTIFTQVARALTKAHSAGLVHRDLKPGNIFLVRDDDREIVKVLDFGIAKQLQNEVADSNTKTGAIMGTPYYMSPEQARGMKEVDHRTDLWALGVIAFRCLLGRLPFESHALGELFMLIIAEPLPIPSKVVPAVPSGFDGWWAQAVARPLDQRFASAKAMADSLRVALGVTLTLDGVDAAARASDPGLDRVSQPGPFVIPPSPGLDRVSQPGPIVTQALPEMISGQTTIAVAAEVLPAPPPKAARSRGLVAVAALLGVLAVGAAYLTLRGRASGDASSRVPELATVLPTSRNAQAAPEPSSSASAVALLVPPGATAEPLPTSSASAAPTLLHPSAAPSGAPRAGSSAPLRGPLPGSPKAPVTKPQAHDDGV